DFCFFRALFSLAIWGENVLKLMAFSIRISELSTRWVRRKWTWNGEWGHAISVPAFTRLVLHIMHGGVPMDIAFPPSLITRALELYPPISRSCPDFIIPIVSSPEAAELASKYYKEGFKTLKLKVGKNLKADIEVLQAIRVVHPE
ncbi:L-Ala-D/L-Glu epimerase, partial [Trifolium pratense]